MTRILEVSEIKVKINSDYIQYYFDVELDNDTTQRHFEEVDVRDCSYNFDKMIELNNKAIEKIKKSKFKYNEFEYKGLKNKEIVELCEFYNDNYKKISNKYRDSINENVRLKKEIEIYKDIIKNK